MSRSEASLEGTFQQRWGFRWDLDQEYGAALVYALAWRWLEKQGAISLFHPSKIISGFNGLAWRWLERQGVISFFLQLRLCKVSSPNGRAVDQSALDCLVGNGGLLSFNAKTLVTHSRVDHDFTTRKRLASQFLLPRAVNGQGFVCLGDSSDPIPVLSICSSHTPQMPVHVDNPTRFDPRPAAVISVFHCAGTAVGVHFAPRTAVTLFSVVGP